MVGSQFPTIEGKVDAIMNSEETYSTALPNGMITGSVENDTLMANSIFMTQTKERLPDIGSYDLISDIVDEITDVG